MALERSLQHGRVGMAGDADEARNLLIAKLEQLIERSALGFDLRQVLRRRERMDMKQVDAVHLQRFETRLD